EKIALERLFNAGVLMIARREGFQRIYDLRERVLPDWDDAHTPTREESRRALALKAAQALGVTKARWLSAYFPGYLRMSKREITAFLEELVRQGLVIRVEVEGWDEAGYVHQDNRELAKKAADGALRPTATTLLSPFDPLVSDRARAQELFGFAYRIETYT